MSSVKFKHSQPTFLPQSARPSFTPIRNDEQIYSSVFPNLYTVCPTRYRTRPFFNNPNTNEDIATKFEQKYVRCVRNEKECVCSACL